MKRNVVLFSLLGIGVLYLFFGTEQEHTSTKRVHLDSEKDSSEDSETTLYHTRRLLSFENFNSSVSTSGDYKDSKVDQLGKETSRNFDLRSLTPAQRRKRNVPLPEQQYAWKFNLNVTRRENNTSNEPAYQGDDTPERRLGMAMSVSGNGPDQSVGDLYQAWDSVGQFLRTLFGGTFDELKDKGHDVSLDISPLPNGTVELPRELFLEGSGEEDSQELQNRRGKFLLGIFGFGGNQENPPRDEGSGEMDVQEFVNTESKVQEFVLNSTETFGQGETSPDLEIVSTENLKSPTARALLGRAVIDEDSPTTNLASSISSNKEPLLVESCTDCEFQTESFVPTDVNVLEQIQTIQPLVSSTVTPFIPFSDETVKNFCVAIFSRMRTSGRSVEEGSGNIESLVSDATASNSLTDDPVSQNMGFFETIWNRIIGRRNAAVVEEPTKDSRRARLIRFGNLFGGFGGSGRSVDLDEVNNIDLEEFKDDLTVVEDEERFLLDCERFMKSAHTETRPNIFDLVDPHLLESLTTESKTRGDELEEQDIEDLNEKIAAHFESTTQNEVYTILSTIYKTNIEGQTTESLNYYNESTEYENEHLEENEKLTVPSGTDLVYTEAYEKAPNNPLSVHSLVVENDTASQGFPTTEIIDDSILTYVPEIRLTTTETYKNPNDERSFNLFGFGLGSGRDDGSSDTSNIDERIFGFINFGSGEREIKEKDISTEDVLDQTTESFKQRSFGIFNLFGSGERAIPEEILSTEHSLELEARELVNVNGSDNEDILTSTVANEGRIFGFLGFGSGEREFPETSELETERGLLSNPTTKGSNVDRLSLFVTSEFSVEISEQRDDLSTNDPRDESKDERFFNLNIFGSGDDRIIPDDSTDTEDLVEVTTSETSTLEDVDTIPPIKTFCLDCEETKSPSMEQITTEVSLVDEMSSTDSTNQGKIPRNGLEVTSATETFESTTMQDRSRLFNTIFLTGSGEGGLFVDNKGPINLVQETEFTPPPVFQPPVQPGRGARKHDSLDFQIPTQRSTQVMPVQSTTENGTDIQPTTELSTSNTFVTEDGNETDADFDLPGIDEDNWKLTFDHPKPSIVPASSEVTVSSTSERTISSTSTEIHTTTKNISTFTRIDTTTSVIVSTSPKIQPRIKFVEPRQRVCTSASQCNRTLNERCITDGPTAMCNCGRSYVRSPETGKCEAPVLLTTSLKLPGEAYHEDLKNKNSERFRKLANDSIETMWILLGDDPEVFRLVAGVDVSGFDKGSLVVHWEITLAAPANESVAELIQQVDAELKEAFEDEDLLKRAPLNVQDAVLVGVTNDVNPCNKSELNYCSVNADCIRDPIRNFKCQCKDDFEDKSADKNHPGEICTAKCPTYYCGDHGECKLKQNGVFHCSCSSWYFGERCEISGIVVIASFASFNALLIVIVLLLVCYCRKRRYRQSQFYGQNQVRFQPESELGRFRASPRHADTIAMNEVGPTKASKYMAVSTPMQNTPDIRLTSPSILGSSVDYDYDSTFDRTPSLKEVNVEVHKSSPKI